VGDIHG
jgi:serine/threonine-protein phosphatase PP1 catalytic subunit